MYEMILDEVKALADEEYKSFHGSLIPGVKTEFLGVRVPKLRTVAKRIIRENWREFLKEYENTDIYEIIMLYGMVLAGAKCDFEEKLGYVRKFIPKIDNWAVCDVVCGDLKDIKMNRKRMYEFLQPYLVSDREYEVRFAAVALMQYYITEDYIDTVLEWYKKICLDAYYVKMAVAWGLSVCFIKFREKTLAFLEDCEIDKFTYNKAIQKMRESYRVSKEDKEMLKGMKQKTFI